VIPSFVSSIGNSAFQNCNTLENAYFYGHAPLTFGTNVFTGTASGFTIYYLPVRVGWSSPTWNGYPTATFSAIFALTLEAGIGGNIIRGSSDAYQVGQEINLTAAPDRGYRFSHWETSGYGEFDDIKNAVAVFTMPAEDTTVKAIFELIPPEGSWQDEGNFDTSWYNASSAAFVLSTPEQLAGLARLVNDGNDFSAKTVSLNADIVLSNYNWVPIGTQTDGVTRPFAGTFNGQDHIIIGLFINSTDGHQGLFRYNTGTIRNVGITIGNISGSESTAAIAGHNTGLVQNCYNMATITSTGRAGGIVGDNDSGGVIENCFNTGNISGKDYLGGIAGYNNSSRGVIRNCYNTGNIRSDGKYSGGIVGFNDGGLLNGCYWMKNGIINTFVLSKLTIATLNRCNIIQATW